MKMAFLGRLGLLLFGLDAVSFFRNGLIERPADAASPRANRGHKRQALSPAVSSDGTAAPLTLIVSLQGKDDNLNFFIAVPAFQ